MRYYIFEDNNRPGGVVNVTGPPDQVYNGNRGSSNGGSNNGGGRPGGIVDVTGPPDEVYNGGNSAGRSVDVTGPPDEVRNSNRAGSGSAVDVTGPPDEVVPSRPVPVDDNNNGNGETGGSDGTSGSGESTREYDTSVLSGDNINHINYDDRFSDVSSKINGIAINYEKPENYNLIRGMQDAEKEFD